jgi:hypothetical protein
MLAAAEPRTRRHFIDFSDQNRDKPGRLMAEVDEMWW